MKKYIFIVMLITIFAGCSSDEQINELSSKTVQEEVKTVRISDNTTVTPEIAEKVAQDVNSRFSRAKDLREVESIEVINDKKGQPAAYIINYMNNCGFVIVSASMDYTPVLAHSDHGHFDINIAKGCGAGVVLDGEIDKIEHIEEVPDSIRMRYRAAWEKYNNDYRVWNTRESRSSSDVYSLISRSISNWQSQGYTVYMLEDYFQTQEFSSLPYETQDRLRTLPTGYANSNYGGIYRTSFALVKHIGHMSSRGPLLSTEWHQDNPYNQFLDSTSYHLGCVTVAMGQVMNYHGYPSFGTSSYDIGQKLTEIRTKLGHPVSDRSASASVSDAIRVFRQYGYNSAHEISHNTDSIQNELLNNKPVIMLGRMYDPFWPFGFSQHAWVCDGFYWIQNDIEVTLMCLEDCPDGYEPHEFFSPYTYSAILNASEMYSMNWGFADNAGQNDTNLNGYYKDDDIRLIDYQGKEHNYNLSRKEIIDIHR